MNILVNIKEIIMRVIKEELIDTKSDRESIKRLSILSNRYPTEKGYAIQCWMSPCFVHIIVYDLNKVDGK